MLGSLISGFLSFLAGLFFKGLSRIQKKMEHPEIILVKPWKKPAFIIGIVRNAGTETHTKKKCVLIANQIE